LKGAKTLISEGVACAIRSRCKSHTFDGRSSLRTPQAPGSAPRRALTVLHLMDEGVGDAAFMDAAVSATERAGGVTQVAA
jgi:hypothetical protein